MRNFTSPTQNTNWQSELHQAIRTPEALLQALQLDQQDPRAQGVLQNSSGFPLLVTSSYLNRMQKSRWDDPLLRQVLPLIDEQFEQQGFHTDPVGDQDAALDNGLIHKYAERALLITTAACPIHCRYCFRRHFPYQAHNGMRHEWAKAVDYLKKHTDIEELILSGGDPWVLSDQRLNALMSVFQEVKQLKRLRIHTRVPVALPSRVNPHLLQWLDQLPWQTVIVTHINHANELDADDVRQALAALQRSSATLLNQGVLLAGVNDSASAIIRLSKQCFENGILPYYINTLDSVLGAAHFAVPADRIQSIILETKARLPGYLQPRFVKDTGSHHSKQNWQLLLEPQQ